MSNPPTRPCVLARVGAAPPVLLFPGDIVGRLASASLYLDDPRISEAHAYLSLRGGRLVLLGLRGRLGVDGHVVREVALHEGAEVQLARDVVVRFERLVLPSWVLAIEGDGLPRQVLTGACSLVLDPEPSLARGAVGAAALQWWQGDDGWKVRQADGRVADVLVDDQWTVNGRTFRACRVQLDTLQTAPTRRLGALGSPLLLRALYDSVHIERDGEVVVTLSGRSAQLVSELVAFGGPAPWAALAGEVWGRTETPEALRPRLDVTLGRMRRKLEVAGVRRDLVRMDGCGQVELVLGPQDRVVGEDG